MEWRAQEVFKLISLYKEYECLWNFKSVTYKRPDLKKHAWKKMANEFKKDVDEIKKKIKNLRNTYVVEKKKVDRSKKPGSSTEHIYEPHLFYYDDMSFLDSVVVLRTTSDTLRTDVIQEQDDLNVTLAEDDPLSSTSTNIQRNTASSISSGSETAPSPMVHRRRSSRKVQNDSKTDKAVNAVAGSVTANEPDDVYTSFGKTIALQLRQLPLVDATETMSEIHSLITSKILAQLRNRNESNFEHNESCTDEADISFGERFNYSP